MTSTLFRRVRRKEAFSPDGPIEREVRIEICRGDADGSAGRVQLRFRSGNVTVEVDQIGWQYRRNLMLKRQLPQIEARRRASRRCFTHEDGQRISRHIQLLPQRRDECLSWSV